MGFETKKLKKTIIYLRKKTMDLLLLLFFVT